MNAGDIFVVEETPCENNDIVEIMECEDYPVYGVVKFQDDDNTVNTFVVDTSGNVVSGDWYFKNDEVIVIEEADDFIENLMEHADTEPTPRPMQQPQPARWANPRFNGFHGGT